MEIENYSVWFKQWTLVVNCLLQADPHFNIYWYLILIKVEQTSRRPTLFSAQSVIICSSRTKHKLSPAKCIDYTPGYHNGAIVIVTPYYVRQLYRLFVGCLRRKCVYHQFKSKISSFWSRGRGRGRAPGREGLYVLMWLTKKGHVTEYSGVNHWSRFLE